MEREKLIKFEFHWYSFRIRRCYVYWAFFYIKKNDEVFKNVILKN